MTNDSSYKRTPVGPDDFIDGKAITNIQIVSILGSGFFICFTIGMLLNEFMSENIGDRLRHVWIIKYRIESLLKFSPISIPYYVAALVCVFPLSIALCVCFTNRFRPASSQKKRMNKNMLHRAYGSMLIVALLFIAIFFVPIDDPNGLSQLLLYPAFPILAVLTSILPAVAFLQFLPWLFTKVKISE
ncbi:hypothetical protein [uncultured Roseobacter sp.]|uniref:hypothetical protein n=1 Tax=uncultured Roseobacter sp. TaxID=114847 RepID=UPI00261BAC89|nr:hypothetical protein [uncultured Roseobacter sp.]